MRKAESPLTVPLPRDGGPRNHRYILSAKPIGRTDRNPHHRLLGIRQCERRLTLEIVAFCGRQSRPRGVSFAIIDDAQLVPGEGIVVVALDGDPEHPLGLVEIVTILGRDQSMAEKCRNEWLVRGKPDRFAKRLQCFAGPARFEQYLSPQLKEERI